MTGLPPAIAVVSSIGERSGPQRPVGFGHLQIVRLLRQVGTAGEDPSKVLRFKAVPFSRSTRAKRVTIRFVEQPEAPVPQFDADHGVIELGYPSTAMDEVRDLLRSGRERFCYFWKSADGSGRRAWIMASP